MFQNTVTPLEQEIPVQDSPKLEGFDAEKEEADPEMKRTEFCLPTDENNIRSLEREALNIDLHHPTSAQLLSKRSEGDGMNDREMSLGPNMAHSPSTVGFLPRKNGTKSFLKRSWTKTQILVFCLVFFVLITCLMTALFVWSYLRNEQTATNPKPIVSGNIMLDPLCKGHEKVERTCKWRPRPISLTSETRRKLKDGLKILENNLKLNYVELGKIKGCVFEIVYDKEIVFTSELGASNISEGIPPTRDTVWPVASLAKIFPSIMMYILEQRGKISTTEEFSKIVKDFKINDPFKSGYTITPRDLASHMAGLIREGPCHPDSYENMCPYNDSTMWERISKLDLYQPPGSFPMYSNLGLAILGNGLAAEFGNGSFETMIRTNIFDKLGMSNSTFILNESVKEKSAVGYMPSGPYRQLEWGWLRPAGGLFTTVSDMSKLVMELLSDNGTLLNRDVVAELFSPVYVFPDGCKMMGTPWEMYFHDPYLIRAKEGAIYGFGAFTAIVPELKLGFTILHSGPESPAILAMTRNIVDLFHKTLSNAQVRNNYVLPKNYKEYEGMYRESTGVPTITSPSTVKYNELTKTLQLTLVTGITVDLSVVNETEHIMESFLKEGEYCYLYTISLDYEKIYFEKPDNQTGKSPGFKMNGVHPSGYGYFTRTDESKQNR